MVGDLRVHINSVLEEGVITSVWYTHKTANAS